jgi:hypothetical protein
LPITCVRAGSRRSRRIARRPRTLRGDEDSMGQRFAEQSHEPPIALDRARRDAGAGEHQRHAESPAAVIQVRPDLRFEDHGETGLNTMEKPPHRSWKIDGHVAHIDARAEQGLGAHAPRRRDRGQYQRHIGAAFQQRFDERHSSLHFADRHRVHPDAAGARPWPEAETLREAAPVHAVAKSAQRERADHDRARSDRRCRCRGSASELRRTRPAEGRPTRDSRRATNASPRR